MNNKDNNPLISIVVPSYNSAQWLPDTINSILNQTYENIEIIVVDDCSNDNTYEVVSQFKNVKYIKNDINMGECYSSCRGFRKALGEYICRLSSDDMYANPDKLKNQVIIMKQNNADWSYNSINCVGENIQTAKLYEYFWMPVPVKYCYQKFQIFDNYFLKFPYFVFIRMFFRNPVNSSTLMFKKSSYIRSIQWSNGKQRTDCDGLLLYDLFLKKFKCVAIRELGSFYRIHPNQMSYDLNYLNAVRDNKLEAINNVLIGKYPLWLKFMVKVVKIFV
jgi:glycosyltransferase involved in cell wall biosynthesis